MFIKSLFRFLPRVKNVLYMPCQCCNSNKGTVYAVNLNILEGSKSERYFTTGTNKNDTGNDIKLVYYGMLTPQIKAVKWLSLSSSFVGVVAQPFLYSGIVATGNLPIIIVSYSFIGFFTVVTPFLLHSITKKYITHLEYDDATGNYIAKTVSFFCITKEIKFKPEDVKIPDVPGMFTSLVVNDTPLFLAPSQFHYPEHYAKIMGYDKPIDFKLSEPPEKHEKSI